ncbi:cytoskeleton protein RodZ [Marinobacter antarcticus]|uniref:Cytoskeleton protein RodZ n=1 Tax=Marinobacter antarcticus TaxID=564117 RepID=A0A1M6U298_9GAMM|nr:RodZ domain-containing protein [Marinobacter antarcticus]SHK63395.1 cytoskeleton protein RodZ [Marinobacter antarcticus]
MTSDETQQTVSTETVGQQLKKARERHGLSISQIADAQHLRIVVIQAIENGDYGQIDSELFLKGYARAYAKQVGLNGDTIIADLNRELEPARLQKARELEANPLVDIERRRRRKQRIGKLLLLVAAAVFIGGLVVMFVVPKFSSGEVGDSLSTMSAPGNQASEAGSTAASDTLQGLNSDRPDPQTETEAEAAAAPEAGAAGSVLPDDIVQDQIPVVAQSTEPALAQSLVSEDAASLSGRLEIDFTGDCWVQVQDATGNSLASSLKRAGDKLEVSGQSPLKVVIGAVDTVKAIRFQGEPVDIADFPVVNNRSEFTLTI